ncbi:MAG: succinylglutamate desuccinylase/aspartoacylase family protein [Gammaproteobacteria bacterium]
MVDRRDLNRAFPGRANSSVASIVAHTVFDGVILGCSYLVDLHTGAKLRTNSPQVVLSGSALFASELHRDQDALLLRFIASRGASRSRSRHARNRASPAPENPR